MLEQKKKVVGNSTGGIWTEESTVHGNRLDTKVAQVVAYPILGNQKIIIDALNARDRLEAAEEVVQLADVLQSYLAGDASSKEIDVRCVADSLRKKLAAWNEIRYSEAGFKARLEDALRRARATYTKVTGKSAAEVVIDSENDS